jgi:hypothetical protein
MELVESTTPVRHDVVLDLEDQAERTKRRMMIISFLVLLVFYTTGHNNVVVRS